MVSVVDTGRASGVVAVLGDGSAMTTATYEDVTASAAAKTKAKMGALVS